MLTTILIIGGVLLALYIGGNLLNHYYRLTDYDRPTGETFEHYHDQASCADQAYARSCEIKARTRNGGSPKARLAALRAYADQLSDGLVFEGDVIPVDANGISGEWVLSPDADPQRRLLFIHGGSFIVGSAAGHRKLAAKFSETSNAAVLAINYRMMPEHSRITGVRDTRAAYQWMLDNGPDGKSSSVATLIAGDSAGGNLTLSLVGWLKQQSLPMPQAVVALSPITDSALSGPSFAYNGRTDLVLETLANTVRRSPAWLQSWVLWGYWRKWPFSPEISPAFGDLSSLPPTLIHASDTEVLLSDSIRYVNKAVAAGSPVTLQIWRGQVHDWHLFADDTEAQRVAFEEIRKWYAKVFTG